MARRKQNNLHAKFHSTISASRRFRVEDDEEPEFEGTEEPSEPGPQYGQGRKGGPKDSPNTLYQMYLAETQQQFQKNPDRAVREAAKAKARAAMHLSRDQPGPAAADLDPETRRPRVRSQEPELLRRAEREHTWQTQPNVYRTSPAQRRPPGGFMREDVARSHRAWIDQQLSDPSSEFNKGLDLHKARTGRHTPAQRRRLATYTDALQRGATHHEALEQVRRSRLRETVGRPAERLQQVRRQQGQEAVQKPKRSGRSTKYQSVQPGVNEIKFGISAQAPPKISDLKRRFPNRPENELIQMQQAGTEFIASELLANQKWAHETRRANLLGNRSGRVKEDPDRITIFTTNVGHPAISVPADSLIGQYIIKKRKSVLGSQGVPSSQLRGRFPDAVRDAHIIDVATGASLGIQGRSGIFNTTGYKFGKKTSPGYGRPKPLGSQILYDSSGRPLYDAQGNIRYSEGATRPIDWTTPNIGARILIG